MWVLEISDMLRDREKCLLWGRCAQKVPNWTSVVTLQSSTTNTENERETEVQKLKNNHNSKRKKKIREAVKEQQERQTEGDRRLVPCLQIKAGGKQQPQSQSSQHLLLPHCQVKHIIPKGTLLNGFCRETFTGPTTASADVGRSEPHTETNRKVSKNSLPSLLSLLSGLYRGWHILEECTHARTTSLQLVPSHRFISALSENEQMQSLRRTLDLHRSIQIAVENRNEQR